MTVSARCILKVGAAFILAMVAGCARDLRSGESALDPAGPQAQVIATLWWVFFGVCLVVFLLVMLTLAGALLHRRRSVAMGPGREPILQLDSSQERRMTRVVFGASALTVITLVVLLLGDFTAGRSLHSLSQEPNPIRIQIIARQWWWEVRYAEWPTRFGDPASSNIITTANEIHLPVDPGHPIAVEVQLDSADVIHSFWVPNLHGKRDIIPGHPTSVWLRADRTGTYEGECAEFCGYQHAQMRLVVVAEPVNEFQAWLDKQRQNAPDPTNEMQQRGQAVFLRSTCATCHTIQGTEARARVGPDLTHVASRKLLAAGAVPNVRGHLAGWIVDPQRIKPGTRMPANSLSPGDLRALLEYLETLQ